MITFEVDEKALKMIALKLDNMSSRTSEVLKKAINDTAKKLKGDLKIEVKKNYTAKIRGLNKAISIKKATNRQLEASVVTKGKPLALIQFKNVAGDSVRAQALKKNKLKPITLKGEEESGKDLKSFVAKMSSGHVGIFQRVPGKRMRKHGYKTKDGVQITKGREAIKEFYGNSLVKMVGNEHTVYPTIERKANEYLREAIKKHVKSLTEGN